eukprot:4771972-Prymnesium_polylepis.1
MARSHTRRASLAVDPAPQVGAIIYALGAYDESKYLSVAKAGGDPRARIDQSYRPLKKVKIASCGAAPGSRPLR